MSSKNNEHLKLKFLQYYKSTPIQKYAAAYIGRSEDTITDWKKEDSDFSYQVERAKAEYVQKNLKRVTNSKWILERLFRGNFSKNTVSTTEDTADLKGLIIIKS